MATPATHTWKPSTARTVVIDSFIPVPRGSTAVTPSPLNWATKDPNDVLDYRLDIAPAIVGNQGDSIATIDISIAPDQPGDLNLNSVTADGTTAVFWLSAGQAGTVYTVTIIIGTTNGRVLKRSVLLPVLLLSVPPVPSTAILTAAGAVLTDQNGNPVLT